MARDLVDDDFRGVLVSLSRDGDLAASVLQRLGYTTVRGSSSRGGNQAYHTMLAALGEGRRRHLAGATGIVRALDGRGALRPGLDPYADLPLPRRPK